MRCLNKSISFLFAIKKSTKFAFGSQTVYADISCDDARNDVDEANNIIKKRIVVE